MLSSSICSPSGQVKFSHVVIVNIIQKYQGIWIYCLKLLLETPTITSLQENRSSLSVANWKHMQCSTWLIAQNIIRMIESKFSFVLEIYLFSIFLWFSLSFFLSPSLHSFLYFLFSFLGFSRQGFSVQPWLFWNLLNIQD